MPGVLKATLANMDVVGIECRTANCMLLSGDSERCDKLFWDQTGQVFEQPCTLAGGLACHHNQQPDGRLCLDYEVRVRCGSESSGFVTLVNIVSEFDLWVDGTLFNRTWLAERR